MLEEQLLLQTCVSASLKIQPLTKPVTKPLDI